MSVLVPLVCRSSTLRLFFGLALRLFGILILWFIGSSAVALASEWLAWSFGSLAFGLGSLFILLYVRKRRNSKGMQSFAKGIKLPPFRRVLRGMGELVSRQNRESCLVHVIAAGFFL